MEALDLAQKKKKSKGHDYSDYNHYSDYSANAWKISDAINSFVRKENSTYPSQDNTSFRKKAIIRQQSLRDIALKLNKNFYSALSSNLQAIIKCIEESKVLLTYEDNWDECGSLATDVDAYNKAVDFLTRYAKSIYDEFNIVLKAPYIDVMNDGDVYIHWKTDKGEFLIIFKKGPQPISYFYGENKETKVPFKGGILNNGSIEEHIAYWMKNYLV